MQKLLAMFRKVVGNIPYAGRLIIVIISFLGIPSLIIYVLPTKMHWEVFFCGIVLWLASFCMLSRYLLVLAPYVCNRCGENTMRTHSEETERQAVIKCVCDSCGYEEDTGVTWHSD